MDTLEDTATVTLDQGNGDVAVMPLSQFFRINADLSEDEAIDIRETLENCAVYIGGGGAQPIWTLTLGRTDT